MYCWPCCWRRQLDTFVEERPDGAGRLHEVTADEHAAFALVFANGTRGLARMM